MFPDVGERLKTTWLSVTASSITDTHMHTSVRDSAPKLVSRAVPRYFSLHLTHGEPLRGQKHLLACVLCLPAEEHIYINSRVVSVTWHVLILERRQMGLGGHQTFLD